MTTTAISSPYPTFVDGNGLALSGGFVYLGVAGQNAQTNPIAVYWDTALTQPAAQPIRTLNGYAINGASPAVLFTASTTYSMVVRDKNAALVFSALSTGPGAAQPAVIIYAQTAAEIAAGVTPTDYSFVTGDVRRYGAVDGGANSTAAFTSAHASSLSVYYPAGTWNIDTVVISQTNTVVHTEGFATILQQRAGNIGTRLVVIQASGVSLGSLYAKGNIGTDTGEQNHAVFVGATAVSISSITIGDLYGQDLRGDVLYLNAPAGQTTTNIKFGRITGKNILRNIVTLGGASFVRGESAIVDTSCGYTTLDVEPNAVPSTDVYVGLVRGAVLQCAPSSAALTAQRIHFGSVSLDPAFANDSTPAYASRNVSNAVVLRNTIDITIDHLSIANHTGLGVNYIWNAGEQEGKAIKIGYLAATGVGASEVTYNALMQVASVDSLEIGDADVALQAVGDYVVFGSIAKTHLKIGSMRVDGTVARFCSSSSFERISINSANVATAFRDMNDSVVRNSDITLPRLGSNLNRVTFESVSAACSTSYISGSSTNCRKVNTQFGGASASGTFTLSAATSTTVANVNVSADSQILLMPTNAAAALITANPGLYVSSRTEGTSFVVGIQSGSAAGTEIFAYTIL